MLVLTRKLQQQIKIGDQITVTILRVKGNTVRVGIEAPRAVRVVRGELPKNGAESEAPSEHETAELLIEAAVASAEDEANGDVALADETTESCTAASQPPVAALSAAQLPLRRIHNRHGSAPLKQIVASCASLAK